MQKAIIDADSMIWVTAYHLQDVEPDFLGLQKCHEKFMTHLSYTLNAVRATHWMGFIGDEKSSDTFRHKLATFKPYKGQRPAKPDFMKNLEEPIRDYMINVLKMHTCPGMEADDAVRIMMEEHPDAILCCVDKDLRQVPGRQYNMQKKTFHDISFDEAQYSLYYQMLIGDTSDNIAGIPKCGPKTAEKILQGIPAHKLRYAVLFKYIEHFGEYDGIRYFWENFQLVRMLCKSQCERHKFVIPTVWNEWSPVMVEEQPQADAEELLGGLL